MSEEQYMELPKYEFDYTPTDYDGFFFKLICK